jgi:hypothetical protein
MTPDASTEGTSLRVRHFDGTVQATAEWTHRNALAPQCPMPIAQCPITPLVEFALLVFPQKFERGCGIVLRNHLPNRDRCC